MSAIYMTVAGRVATTPERHVSDGRTRVVFRVASTERRYVRARDQWGDAETVYLTVTCWRQLAESVHQSLRLGDPVVVHGKLLSRTFDLDGRPQTRIELGAEAVGPDLRWSTAVVTRTRSAAAEAPQGPAEGHGTDEGVEAGAAAPTSRAPMASVGATGAP
jgi:single-strand DNA-binding protein